MPNKNKKKILIFDSGYHSHMGYYSALKAYYDLEFCASIHRLFQLSSMQNFHYDIVIIYPMMYGHGFFGDRFPDSQIGQAVYRKFFEHMNHTKVIVWAHNEKDALEHWGDNVKRREIILPHHHFDFLPVVHGIMTKKTKKNTTMDTQQSTKLHSDFDQQWSELPEYAGYVPEQFVSWKELKRQFDLSDNYGPSHPLPINIQKDDTIIVVNLYGFKRQTSPRVALCKNPKTNENIAIVWE